MSNEVDGNEYFLNKYLDEQAKHEDEEEVNEKEEFTGEEMYNLLGDNGFYASMESLHEANEEYLHGGFGGAIDVANSYLNKKEVYSPSKYLKELTTVFYKGTHNWFDTKWLALEGDEGTILEKVVEFLGDIVYESDSVFPEDYVEMYMLGNELLEEYQKLDPETRKHANSMLFNQRKEVAKWGLKSAGLTEQYVLNSTPEDVSNRLLANTREVGRIKKRLQLNYKQYVNGMEVLGLTTTELDKNKVDARNYANIYKLYKRPTTSKEFLKVAVKMNSLLTLRSAKDENFKHNGKEAKDAGLVMYKAGSSWVVIGSRLTVFYPGKEGSKMLYNKPLNEVRVKDMEQIAKTIK